jgi:hypothetical protein
VRHFGGNLVGYRSSSGAHKVILKEGLLGIVPLEHPGDALMRVDLYEDIGGDYFPLLQDPSMYYRRREDGRVERVVQGSESSRGTVVQGLRAKG